MLKSLPCIVTKLMDVPLSLKTQLLAIEYTSWLLAHSQQLADTLNSCTCLVLLISEPQAAVATTTNPSYNSIKLCSQYPTKWP